MQGLALPRRRVRIVNCCRAQLQDVRTRQEHRQCASGIRHLPACRMTLEKRLRKPGLTHELLLRGSDQGQQVLKHGGSDPRAQHLTSVTVPGPTCQAARKPLTQNWCKLRQPGLESLNF